MCRQSRSRSTHRQWLIEPTLPSPKQPRGLLMSSDNLLSTAQAAAISGIAQARIRQLCKDGTLRAHRGKRVWLIPREEVARLGAITQEVSDAS